jgi:hypothetical protein
MLLIVFFYLYRNKRDFWLKFVAQKKRVNDFNPVNDQEFDGLPEI